MFKDINKSMLLKLVALHVIVIIVSNALVAVPVEIMGIKLTWAAFTFPLVVIATDLTVRLLGKSIARQTIAVAYPLAIIGSIAGCVGRRSTGIGRIKNWFRKCHCLCCWYNARRVCVPNIEREVLPMVVGTSGINRCGESYRHVCLLCCCIQQQCGRVHGGKLGRDRRITSGIENTIGSGHLPTGLRITTQTSV